MKSRLLLASSLAVLMVPALTSCAGDAAAPPVSIFALQQGQCFTPDEEHLVAFPVPCAEPHLYEVTLVAPIEEEAFPGDEAVQEFADEVCPEAFSKYTGITPAAATDWTSMAFGPTESGWNEQDDRAVVCVVTSSYGEAQSGSAKGVASEDPTPEGTS